jgi:hypothetical protein
MLYANHFAGAFLSNLKSRGFLFRDVALGAGKVIEDLTGAGRSFSFYLCC